MVYTQTTWVDGSGGGTPVNAARLNKMEQGIADAQANAGFSLGTNYVNVRNYAPNGSDWSGAIQSAITAAGIGGTVFFPKLTGGYGMSIPKAPLERQRWIGMHSPWYEWDGFGTESRDNALIALSGFTGAALVHYATPGNNRGASFSNLCFIGLGDTTGSLNGIDFGPSTSGGERAALVRECQFEAFGGAALAGHMWVTDLRDCHISRCGYGIRPASGAGGSSCVAFDSRWTGGMIYFTYHHGIAFDSSSESGQIDISHMRIERAGTQVSGSTVSPNSNRDETAVAIYGTRLHALTMSNLTTDANAGGDLKFVGMDPNKLEGSVNTVIGTGLILKRSGTGNNSTSTLPAIWLDRVKYVDLRGKITFGDPDDNGTGRSAPQAGIWTNKAYFTTWDGSAEIASGNTQATLYNGQIPAASTFTGTNEANFASYARDPRYNSWASFAL